MVPDGYGASLQPGKRGVRWQEVAMASVVIRKGGKTVMMKIMMMMMGVLNYFAFIQKLKKMNKE